MYEQMRSSGVESVRSLFYWANVETAKGTYNWAGLDRTVGLSATHRLSILATIQGTPRWASTQPGRGDYATYPPKNLKDLQDFIGALIARYGPKGDVLDRQPHHPEAPDPRVADLERALGELLPERQELPERTTRRC